ncbi:OmpA family protein [Metabacillus niabensis]|uniref:Outer membrane protein OmpA-like peptidoglycan-associated protein n=1 Tax=Metabacillus niabensis TaxID=324854 RepID=A0ABT9Z412_9BACI|nr:OmpA family protein [Metabacillus niabensis]MDQ0227004.1 outer membrane protein OmpA-like peptidoglycan-associated protein [Metabacillus niabensis]
MKNKFFLFLFFSVISLYGCQATEEPVVTEIDKIEGTEVTPGQKIQSNVKFDVNFDQVDAEVIEKENAIILRMEGDELFNYYETEFPKESNVKNEQANNNRAIENFHQLVKVFSELPNKTKVNINVYTDDKDDDNFNLQLTKDRANYLIEQFQTQQQLNHIEFSATGFGEANPIVPNSGNPEDQLKNRRVEFVIEP